MIKIYVAFDDTDTLDCGRGTGKLARWFEDVLPKECTMWGIVRQQLLHAPGVPMTSHNSSLTCVVQAPDKSYTDALIELAASHVQKHFVEGSDPGICVATELDKLESLITFGLRCTGEKTTQAEAMEAAQNVHLSGHGGTQDGIIGAAAGVGLTVLGESGRIISYGDIRALPEITTAGDLRERGIHVMSANRHAEYIPNHHTIDNQGSLRPHLYGGRLVVPVLSTGNESWQNIAVKKEYNFD